MKFKKGFFMKRNLLMLCLAMITLISTGCVTEVLPTITQSNSVNTTTPPPPKSQQTSTTTYQRLQTVQGPTLTVGIRPTGFTFPDFQGKIVLLEVFGKECHYCFEEMPTIHRLYSKYRQNLQVISLQAQDPMSKATANNLIRRFNMNYPIVDKNHAIDLLYVLKSTYAWNGILPFMLLIKNGVTEYSFRGQVSQQELEKAIQMLIQTP